MASTTSSRGNGDSYVLVPAAEYRRLRAGARGTVTDAVRFADRSIGRDLRARRLAAGLSQVETARRAGLRTETLSRLEHGRGNPTVATIQRILRALERR